MWITLCNRNGQNTIFIISSCNFFRLVFLLYLIINRWVDFIFKFLQYLSLEVFELFIQQNNVKRRQTFIIDLLWSIQQFSLIVSMFRFWNSKILLLNTILLENATSLQNECVCGLILPAFRVFCVSWKCNHCHCRAKINL